MCFYFIVGKKLYKGDNDGENKSYLNLAASVKSHYVVLEMNVTGFELH